MTELTVPGTDPEVAAVRNTVSHSEVESWLRCDRQHFYGYSMGIQRDSEHESTSLARGTLGHEALAIWFEHLMTVPNDVAGAYQAALVFLTGRAPISPVIAGEVMGSP